MPTPPRVLVIDPVKLAVGGVAAGIGVAILVLFVWMVPTAAARESLSACRGIGGFEPIDSELNHASTALCPGGKACQLPVEAPDFTAVDVAGKSFKLSDFRGKVVLLNFWASWCNVCKAEKPALDAMARELGGEDLVVITLASDKTWSPPLLSVMQTLATVPVKLPPRDAEGDVPLSELQKVFDQAMPRGVPFKVLLDPPSGDGSIGQIAAAWGIKAVPESALIDREGKIRAYFVNKRDWTSPVARTCIRSLVDED
jgi:thiol-disulfide isomerase/thioredoxin